VESKGITVQENNRWRHQTANPRCVSSTTTPHPLHGHNCLRKWKQTDMFFFSARYSESIF